MVDPIVRLTKRAAWISRPISRAKVSVDGHSSSPAFSEEARQLAFALNKIGAASPADVVQMVHPPGEDALLESIKAAEIAKAELIAAHPELALGKPGHKAH